MYNNHPDYLFHLIRTVMDRNLPDVLFTHKDPMGPAKLSNKYAYEVWQSGDTLTVGQATRPFFLLWSDPNTPLRLPDGMIPSTIAVNGVVVPEAQLDLGNNLLLPFGSEASPSTPVPYYDPQRDTMRANWPVTDRQQIQRRPTPSKVVSGEKDESLRGIAFNSDEYPIEVFGTKDMSGKPLGVFSRSGLQVKVETTRQGSQKVSLFAQPHWPRPLYVRYTLIPQRIVTFKIASREAGFDKHNGTAARVKPSHMGYTEDKNFGVYAQFFSNMVDLECWANEPAEAMRLAEEVRVAMLNYAGFLKEMGVNELVFDKILTLDDRVKANRDTETSHNFWSKYRVSFYLRSEEVYLLPAKGLYDIRLNAVVQDE